MDFIISGNVDFVIGCNLLFMVRSVVIVSIVSVFLCYYEVLIIFIC